MKDAINASSTKNLTVGNHPIGITSQNIINDSLPLKNNFIENPDVYPFYEIQAGQPLTNVAPAGSIKVVFILQKI